MQYTNNFEGSLTTGFGTWARVETGGSITHDTSYRQSGSYSLNQHQEDTSHNAWVEERLEVSLAGKTVNKVKLYNIATHTTWGYSWWAWCYSQYYITDGTNSYSYATMDYGPQRETPVSKENSNTAQCGSATGVDGRTWYCYEYTIPAGWNKNNIKIQLITDADGGDQHVLAKTDSWWDLMYTNV